jgi:hypothetical protein
MSVRARLLIAALPLLVTVGATAQLYPVPPPEQAAQYAADVPKTILELQPFQQSHSLAIEGQDARQGSATLIELNPYIKTWLVLTLDWGGADGRATYHLQNPDRREQRIRLAPNGLVVTAGDRAFACDLWLESPSSLEQAGASGLPYAPLCDGRLYVRNSVAGRRTDLERATDFLRDHVWGGEAIVGFVRDHLFRDAHREEGSAGAAAPPTANSGTGPRPALLGEAYARRTVAPEHLGIDVIGVSSGQLVLGGWYPAEAVPSVYLSVVQPEAIASSILESHPDRANRLDSVEASALDYLVAFDLGSLDLGFALGSDHPRVAWSPRPPEAVRDAALPGPDGIGTTAPLVTNGMVSAARLERTVATFTGGFKREHGAFKYGDLAGRNRGSHYGFIEEGVIFSKLQPGLATLYVMDDGTVGMKTWSAEDDLLLPGIRYARQNGVALVEPDPATGEPAPGALVPRWGPGNWSGSAAGELRALRAGACLQESEAGRFLIYGWFSTATPSAMTRVFQAYGCRYAMLLDMNALEHTYLALYTRAKGDIVVQHLIRGMEEVDKSTDEKMIPRFIGFPDNRDFFYLMRREDLP